ncbi:MAG TPA: hypothetical protein VIR01_13735 [Pyrinomonadaceae bacterium]
MTEETTNEAFDAIHDEASRLLALVPPDAPDFRGGLHLIMSLARYKHDVRSVAEINKVRGE